MTNVIVPRFFPWCVVCRGAAAEEKGIPHGSGLVSLQVKRPHDYDIIRQEIL